MQDTDRELETLPPELEKFWRTDDGLTPVQRAEAFGIDVEMLMDNTRQTPQQRIRLNDTLLNQALALREAFANNREKS